MMTREDVRAIDQARELFGDAIAEPPPSRSPRRMKAMPWRPRLGPIGNQILSNRASKTKFLYGERGSAKTAIALNDLIYHCYDCYTPGYSPPMAVICTLVRSSATEGGAWEKLHSLYLPEWFDGIGLEATEPRMDDTKARFCFIATKYGGWARVVLKSIPYGESIRGRMKGLECSYFFFDELTETDHPDYYLLPIQQLRRPTGSICQFVGAGNPPPEGTDHWTWKVMVEGAAEKVGNKDPIIPVGGGRLDGLADETAVYHVPIAENVYWSDEQKKQYRETLLYEGRLDPTAVDRLVYGKWTPRPTGEGLFKEFFIQAIHVKGDAKTGTGLRPVPGYPIIIGYDLGQVYSSVTFMQLVPSEKKMLWRVFDEVDHLGVKTLYKKLAHQVLARIKYWREIVGYEFEVIHITDDSATTQWRPGSGSYDAWEFEKEYNRVSEKTIKMLGCPKGPGSVEARVRMLQAKLYQEDVIVSAICKNTVAMLRMLEDDKRNPGNPKRSKHVHKFDSLTYPMLKMGFAGSLLAHGKVEPPSLIYCGTATNP